MAAFLSSFVPCTARIELLRLKADGFCRVASSSPLLEKENPGGQAF
jgi:hypothetical protein